MRIESCCILYIMYIVFVRSIMNSILFYSILFYSRIPSLPTVGVINRLVGHCCSPSALCSYCTSKGSTAPQQIPMYRADSTTGNSVTLSLGHTHGLYINKFVVPCFPSEFNDSVKVSLLYRRTAIKHSAAVSLAYYRTAVTLL